MLIECAYAFLQAEQRLVDLGALGLPILVIALTVLRSLTACQVDQEKLAALADALLLNLDLRDGVTSAGRIIGFCCVRRPHSVALLDEVQDLVVVVDELLLETGDLNRI